MTIKRLIDVALAGVALVLLAPLLLLVAVLIKLDTAGPVFFRQERMGRGVQPFLIYKFRTMVRDAPEKGGALTFGQDPRITRLGRWLRKTKIDELPQLLNILRGDMGFVGPRPEVRKYVEMFPREFEEILQIRPGLTDLASTGEVACLGIDFEEAFLKALLSVGYYLPVRNVMLSTGPIEAKAAFLDSTRQLVELGITLYATKGTADFLHARGIEATLLHWPLAKKSPNTMEYLSQKKVDLVINIPKNLQEEELTNDYLIRRQAVDFGIPLITNLQLAQRFVEALSRKGQLLENLEIRSWEEYERPVGH